MIKRQHPSSIRKAELAAIHNDLYKEVHNFRPRWLDYNTVSVEWLEAEIDQLTKELEANIAFEKERAEHDIVRFENELQQIISVGANDRKTALRWIVQREELECQQDIEGWVYQQGFLFTDYGKSLVREIKQIVDM